MTRTPYRPRKRALSASVLALVLALIVPLVGQNIASAQTPVRAAAALEATAVQTAAALVPGIVTQPVPITAVSGKKIRFTVKASGSGLIYRWYVKYPGKAWESRPQAKPYYQLYTNMKQDGIQVRVLVSSKYGAVTSRAVSLRVLSTFADPVPHGATSRLNVWTVSALGTSEHAWDQIKRANRYNEHAPQGHMYVLTRFKIKNISNKTYDPAYTLNFGFQSLGGVQYKSATVVTSDDLFDVGKLKPGQTADFTVAVAVHTARITNGLWLITDFTSYSNRQLGYFAFL